MDHAAEPTAARCVGLLLDHSRSSSLRHRRQAVCTELQDELSLCPGRGGVLCCAGSRSCERAGQASIATPSGSVGAGRIELRQRLFQARHGDPLRSPWIEQTRGYPEFLATGSRIRVKDAPSAKPRWKPIGTPCSLPASRGSWFRNSRSRFSLSPRMWCFAHSLTFPKIRCVGAAAAFRAGVRFRPALVLIRRLSRRRTRCKSGWPLLRRFSGFGEQVWLRSEVALRGSPTRDIDS